MTHALAMRASGGGGRDGARAQAIEAAFAIIGERGLAGLSMRVLAQAIGKSTTVIVNLFHTKAGLLSAVAQASAHIATGWITLTAMACSTGRPVRGSMVWRPRT